MNSTVNTTGANASANAAGSTGAIVNAAMSSARLAQVCWKNTPLPERLDRIRELRGLIAEHAYLLAGASASARRRPALEALSAEVLPLAEACRFLEREAKTILAPRRLGLRGLPLWLAGVRSEIHHEPLGVILIIGPGNYPLLLPGVQLIQALVAGNAVLLKPGAGGSPAARALIEIIHRAGFDSRLVALLPESTEAARAAIEAHPDKVLFTGSATTGENILAQLAPRLIPATMELSGCDAVIVRPDADLELTVKALKFGLTLNNGATCMAPRRVFVHRTIATELEGRLARSFPGGAPVSDPACSSLPIRAGAEAGATIRVLLSESLARGAHFVAGGITADGAVQLPAILAGVDVEARLLREDIFAPVLALVIVRDDTEAVTRANDCPYALGASIFSGDESTARAIARSLNSGVVSINDLIIPTADARLPLSGRRRSGFGVTRGAEGLLELTAPKVLTVSRARFRPTLEPPRPQDQEMFECYLQLTHGRGLGQRARALVALFKSLTGRTKGTSQSTV